MARILERRRSTMIVQVAGNDEIELVDSEEEVPLVLGVLDKYMADVLERTLEYWYWHRHNSKMPRNRTIETVNVGPGIPTLSVNEDGVKNIQRKEASIDMSTLLDNMNDLRLEMEHTKVLDDPVKRLKMEALLQRVEEAIRFDQNLANTTNAEKESCHQCHAAASRDDGGFEGNRAIELDQESTSEPNAIEGSCCAAAWDDDNVAKNKALHSDETMPNLVIDNIRRTTVALAGGVLTVAGVACIPCPIVPGCLVVYVGLMILATEFESARKALDIVKVPIDRWLIASYDEDDPSVRLSEASVMKSC